MNRHQNAKYTRTRHVVAINKKKINATGSIHFDAAKQRDYHIYWFSLHRIVCLASYQANWSWNIICRNKLAHARLKSIGTWLESELMSLSAWVWPSVTLCDPSICSPRFISIQSTTLRYGESQYKWSLIEDARLGTCHQSRTFMRKSQKTQIRWKCANTCTHAKHQNAATQCTSPPISIVTIFAHPHAFMKCNNNKWMHERICRHSE